MIGEESPRQLEELLGAQWAAAQKLGVRGHRAAPMGPVSVEGTLLCFERANTAMGRGAVNGPLLPGHVAAGQE